MEKVEKIEAVLFLKGIKTPPMYYKSGVSTTILFIYKRPKLHPFTDADNRNSLEGQYLWTETQIFS